MIKWYVEVRKLIRDIATKSMDALKALEADDEAAARPIKEYLKSDYQRLQSLWNERHEGYLPTYLGRHLHFGMKNDFDDILRQDLVELENRIDKELLAASEERGELGFEALLHPVIADTSYDLYSTGHLRDAVLNAIVAIFDLIRTRTGLASDGAQLAQQVFSPNDPHLVLSELATESGQNDQKGFLQIFAGSYLGIRNPKAHTLEHDLTEEKAAQYLVFASLLARRVEEAQLVKPVRRTFVKKKSVPRKP